ncbi:MAG: hypothetical protein CSYNP_03563 [Syntrophus sp. SKADARSKE-3]|nr:hypothetical protein [Syntrophus sp. SKADARSKE-3]
MFLRGKKHILKQYLVEPIDFDPELLGAFEQPTQKSHMIFHESAANKVSSLFIIREIGLIELVSITQYRREHLAFYDGCFFYSSLRDWISEMRDQKNTCKSGSIREMVSLTLPMVVSLSCETLMIFTNRLLLSKISPDAMNASMGGGIAAGQCLSFFAGLVGYTTALVAQQYGAGRRRNASRAAFQAMLIALAAWPLLACLGPFAREVFNHMGLTPEQAQLQSEYFSIVVLGSGLYLLRSALSGFFCGIGRTGVVMLSAIAALIANACAAWVLIFGRLGFQAVGVRGAAIGVLIGTLTGVGVLVAAYLKKEN